MENYKRKSLFDIESFTSLDFNKIGVFKMQILSKSKLDSLFNN